MSTVVKKGKKKKGPGGTKSTTSKKVASKEEQVVDEALAEAAAADAAIAEAAVAEAAVAEVAVAEAAVVDAEQEVALAEEAKEEEAQQAEAEAEYEADEAAVEDDDLGLGEHVTKETKGAHLADVQDDRKSLAATVQYKGGDDDTFRDMKNQAANYDKYSEGNFVNEASEEENENDHLGFMDIEEIQPKQSAAMLEQHLPHILSSWTLVEKIGLERFGVVFMKNVLKFSPESL